MANSILEDALDGLNSWYGVKWAKTFLTWGEWNGTNTYLLKGSNKEPKYHEHVEIGWKSSNSSNNRLCYTCTNERLLSSEFVWEEAKSHSSKHDSKVEDHGGGFW